METGFRFRLLVAVVFTQHWVFAFFFRAFWVDGSLGEGGGGLGAGVDRQGEEKVI